VDTVRRLRAFNQAGVDVAQLVTWSGGQVPVGLIGELSQKFGVDIGELSVFEIGRNWSARIARLSGLLCNSLYVVTRNLNDQAVKKLAASARAVDVNAVLLDGLFGGEIAIQLAELLDVPMFYRSHNIEHLYLRDQAAVAKGTRRRLAQWLASRNVEAFERKIIGRSSLVFDISVDDMIYWKGQGFDNIRWLPPFCDSLPAVTNKLEKCDIAFLGNLFMPNNVQGVRWLLDEVWPILMARASHLTLRIAGSNPVPEIVQTCARWPNVELMPNIDVVTNVYQSARVMVNPVLVGSGVNMKSLELLATGKLVISTSQGVKGLPNEHKDLFRVVDTPQAFAEAILDALAEHEGKSDNLPSRLPECYLPEAISGVVEMMEEVIGQNGASRQ
jgi:hypothetical protein